MYYVCIESKNKNMNINRSKHIWEGWTVGDFIDEIEPMFDLCNPFTTKNDIKKWCKDNQPYYKKHIPEVYKYFLNKINIQ